MQLNCCILDSRLIYHDEDTLTGSECVVGEDTDVYINVHSMYTGSTMILDNACVIFQCMKLLHVSFRISKIIKLSWCKYMKMLPGFFYIIGRFRTRVFCCDSAEEKMSDNCCISNIRLNSRPSNQIHIYGVHLDESIISCLYDIISRRRREHILCLYCIILNLEL